MPQDDPDRRPPDRRPPPEEQSDRDPPPSPRDPHGPHADTNDVAAATDTGPGPSHHPPPPADEPGPPTPRGAHGPHAGEPVGRGAVGGTVKAVYILYFVSVFIPIAVVIGALIAFFKRQPSTAVERSHYDFQIRTFMGTAVAWVIALVLTMLGPAFMTFSWAVLLIWAFWIVIRSAKGLSWAGRGDPVHDPRNWMFGGGGARRADDVDRRPPP